MCKLFHLIRLAQRKSYLVLKFIEFQPHMRMGGLAGLDLGQNPKYASQTLGRLGAAAKFWQKSVFRPF